MLVLSRQRDESVVCNLNNPGLLEDLIAQRDRGAEIQIVLTVVDIRGNKVRLGFQAPTVIQVHRQEVYEAIKKGNERKTDGTSEIKSLAKKP